MSRISEGKSVGIVHDYMDQFSTGFKRKAGMRAKTYEEHGWDNVRPQKPKKGSLRAQMHFDFKDDNEDDWDDYHSSGERV